VIIDEKVQPIIFRSTSRDDVLRHGGTADGLRSGAGITRREFQDVLLIAQRQRVGITNQIIELHRADIVTALGVVTPTIGTYDRAGACGIASQLLEAAGRRLEVSDAVEDALGDEARGGGDTQ